MTSRSGAVTACGAHGAAGVRPSTIWTTTAMYDAVIVNARAEPTLLRNESSEQGHWLQVRLRGARTNRDGVGARVTVIAGDLVQTDEVHSGRGYQSHYGMRLHFGLGSHAHVDRIEVRWIGGGLDVCRDVEVDQLFVLTEGDCKPSASGGSDGR